MADLATRGDISSAPKVELHVHLNGTISETTASALARRHGADPSNALRLVDGRYPGRYPGFKGFLDAYMAANEFVRTPDDLELVASEFALAQAAQNVAYSEAGFTAGILVRNGMDPRAMWAALRRGLAAGGSETRVALIVDAIRDRGTDDASATIRLVEEADAPIVGLSLTGEAGREPIEAFTVLRDAATRLGMGLEVHAGEHQPPRVSSTHSTSSTQIGSAMASLRSKTWRSSSGWSASRCRSTCVRARTLPSASFPRSRSTHSLPSGEPAST